MIIKTKDILSVSVMYMENAQKMKLFIVIFRM